MLLEELKAGGFAAVRKRFPFMTSEKLSAAVAQHINRETMELKPRLSAAEPRHLTVVSNIVAAPQKPPCHRCGAKAFTLPVPGNDLRECRSRKDCDRRCSRGGVPMMIAQPVQRSAFADIRRR